MNDNIRGSGWIGGTVPVASDKRYGAAPMNDRTADLKGVTVLLAQPDAFLEDYLKHALTRAGAKVAAIDAAAGCDPMTTVAAIDVSLVEGADAGIVSPDIPVVLLSSCPERAVPATAPCRPVLRRPFAAFQLLEAVETLATTRERAAQPRSIHPTMDI